MLALLALSALLAACGDSSSGSTPLPTPNSATPTIAPPTTLKTPGTLIVGSDTTYTPMEFTDPTNPSSYQGFDIDLITAIANHLGLKVQVQKDSFDTIFDDLSNKRFDLVISSVTVNPQREAKYDFVKYFNAGESLLVQKGNPKNLKQVSDLCGLAVGVQTGTVEQDDLTAGSKACKQAGKPEIKMTVLEAQTDVINLLTTNRVVATYQDSPVTDYYNKINPGQFEVGGSIVNAAPYGITIRKGDTSMVNAVQKAFDALKSDGTYDKLFNKWQFSSVQKVS